MTVVEMDFRRPRADGDHIPARGYVEWVPSARRDMEGYILLPQPFKVYLENGLATVTAEPTTANWYWKVTEHFDGVVNSPSRYYIVPDSASPIDFDDLVQINNPDSASPVISQDWWSAELQSVRAEVQTMIDDLKAGAPGALDTLNELAAALDDGANFATTVTNSIATKASTTALEAEEAARIAADDDLQDQVTDLSTDLINELAAEVVARNTAIAAEATLARNADNLTSGTVPEARIPDAIARDSEVLAAIAGQNVLDQAAFGRKIYEMAGVELSYGENSTGVVTAVPVAAAAATSIPFCLVTVPANVDPVWINYGAEVSVSVAGAGLISIELWDVTAGGVGTQVHDASLGNVAAQVVLYSGLAQTLHGRYRLEPSTSERRFQLKTLLYRDGGSSLAANVLNSTRTGAPYGFSYIQAEHQ